MVVSNATSDDLLFCNSKTKISEEKVLKEQKVGQDDPIALIGFHIHSRNLKLQEKIDSLENSVLDLDWIKFDTLFKELKKLQVPRRMMNAFAYKMIKTVIESNSSVRDISNIRNKFLEYGFAEAYMDAGYDEGYRSLKSAINVQKPIVKN